MRTILAPIDFSEGTAAVVQTAIQLAEAFGASLHLLHVAPPDPDFVGYQAGPHSVRDQIAHSYREEHRMLQEWEARCRVRGVETTALLIQGATVEKILQEQARLGAEWVVMGSRGHGALRRFLMGSVTEGVLKNAPCPLTIVPTGPST